jgi:hypothetical protein
MFQKLGIWAGTNTQNFDFFSSISWGLCTGTKGEKVVLFGFSTSINCEKLNFYSIKIPNSPLVPGLNPKTASFSYLVPAQRPLEIEEKSFFWVFVPV